MLRQLSTAFLQTASLVVALATLAPAHDFWLEPSSFRPPAGQKLELELVVGERFSGERVRRDETRILAFVATSSTSESAETIRGFDGRSPAGILRPTSPGLLLVGYQSNGKSIELDAAKFESYLREEGLDGVAAERKRRGESERKGREVYARCAKSLLVVQDGTPLKPEHLAGWDRVFGFPLEIVPAVNPCLLAQDAELGVRVLFQGQPLANALVGCMPKQDPAREVRLRTDGEGRVRFRPALGGVHMLRVVHMVRAPEGADHEWQSQWASLTFEAPAR